MKKIILIMLMGLFACAESAAQEWDFGFEFMRGNGLPRLVSDGSEVVWGPDTRVITIATDSVNLASADGSTYKDVINTGNQGRLRMAFGLPNDILTKVRLFIGDYTAITFIQIRIWRRNQLTGTFTLVGSARINPTANGTQDFDVSIPNVKEGDFIGVRILSTGAALNIRSGNANLTVLTKNNADSSNVTFSTTVANSYVPIIVYGNAPAIVFIGNSLVGGSPLHYPYTYTSQISQVDYTWATFPHYTCYRYGIPYQNYSFPGDASSVLLTNIGEVIALNPQLVFLENTNDLNDANSIAPIANQRAIIDSLTAHGIRVAYWMVPPKNATNTIMLRRDTIRTNISAYNLTKNGLVFDSDPSLGIQRDTGTPSPTVPNYWNIKSGYSHDGIHFAEGAYREVGRLADSLLVRNYNLTDTTLIIHAHNPVYDTTEYSPVAVYDTVFSYPDLDSAVLVYNLNGGANSTSKMAITDSTALTNSYNCFKSLSISGDDGDTVNYYITGYYGTKTGVSETKSFRLGVQVPYTTNIKYEWWGDSSATRSEWANVRDTLIARQSTGANQPYVIADFLNGHDVVRFDSTHYYNFTSYTTTDTNFTIMVVYKYIGTNGLGGYILGGTGQGIVTNFDVTSSGWGNTFSSGNYLITNPDTDTNWTIRTFKPNGLFKNGTEATYKTDETPNALVIRAIGTRPDATTLFTRCYIAYIGIWRESLTTANRQQHEAYVNGVLGVY